MVLYTHGFLNIYKIKNTVTVKNISVLNFCSLDVRFACNVCLLSAFVLTVSLARFLNSHHFTSLHTVQVWPPVSNTCISHVSVARLLWGLSLRDQLQLVLDTLACSMKGAGVRRLLATVLPYCATCQHGRSRAAVTSRLRRVYDLHQVGRGMRTSLKR